MKPVREGGGGREEGAIVQPRGDLPGDPHPGGHSNSSSGTAQNGGHGRACYRVAFWECPAAGTWEPPQAENSESPSSLPL